MSPVASALARLCRGNTLRTSWPRVELPLNNFVSKVLLFNAEPHDVSTTGWRRPQMADRELIAAILTAGMLPTLEIPRTRVDNGRGRLPYAEARTIQCAVDHAFGLYRLVLNGLGADPFSMTEISRQPKAPAGGLPKLDQTNDSYAETGARWAYTRSG
jgi:hypothetical protein